MLTDADTDTIPDWDTNKPCETPSGCDATATFMVWCDHHVLGCDYTGLRCEKHLTLLITETIRQVQEMHEAWLNFCARCCEPVEPGCVEDHLRWAKL